MLLLRIRSRENMKKELEIISTTSWWNFARLLTLFLLRIYSIPIPPRVRSCSNLNAVANVCSQYHIQLLLANSQCQYDELNNTNRDGERCRERKVQENMLKLRCLEVHLWSTWEKLKHIPRWWKLPHKMQSRRLWLSISLDSTRWDHCPLFHVCGVRLFVDSTNDQTKEIETLSPFLSIEWI